jgi:ATPase, YjeE family
MVNEGKPVGLNQLGLAAKELVQAGKDFSVWLIEGSMGAGKTTLVKEIAQHMGVSETVVSPTFSLVNEYSSSTGKPIFHFDFYRIKNETEAYDIGTDEYFDSGNTCFIEWFEKIPDLIPSRNFKVTIQPVDAHHRLIHYQAHE